MIPGSGVPSSCGEEFRHRIGDARALSIGGLVSFSTLLDGEGRDVLFLKSNFV